MPSPPTPCLYNGANRHERNEIVYSFDVFDTCITRTHAHPRDLFYDLGMRLAPAGGSYKEAAEFARVFQTRRIRAEKRAYRRVRPYECANIQEIYEQFRSPVGLNLSPEELVAAELALERESIRPIAHMRSQIGELRAAGHRILFISDMYLPADMLAPILVRLGIMLEHEALYVSCDVRLTKTSGNLFRHVLTRENLAPEQLIHTGDNPLADGLMAQRHGLGVRRYAHGPLTGHEIARAGRRLPRDPGRSFLAALSRRSRLAAKMHHDEAPQPLDDVIHSTIAPFLIAYVDWILQDAVAQGIQRLYFVARDGEILLRVARALLGPRDGPELRYLHGSRRAWLGPSIGPADETWKQLLVTPGQVNTRRDILARAGLDREAQLSIARTLGDSTSEWESPLESAAAFAFIERVCDTPDAANLLFGTASEQRAVARAYLADQGLFEDVRWALVDTGWSLNCQAALKRIIEAESGRRTFWGYYMALARNHLDERQAGAYRAFIEPPGSIYSRRRVVVEHAFTPSTHATTRGYVMQDSLAVPAFGKELRGADELAYAHRLHHAVETAATLVASEEDTLEKLRRNRGSIQEQAASFLTHPPRADAQAMSRFGTIADLRHEDAFVQPLCRPLDWKDAIEVAATAISPRRSFMPASFMWLEGSCALSTLPVRITLRAMLVVDALRARIRN